MVKLTYVLNGSAATEFSLTFSLSVPSIINEKRKEAGEETTLENGGQVGVFYGEEPKECIILVSCKALPMVGVAPLSVMNIRTGEMIPVKKYASGENQVILE